MRRIDKAFEKFPGQARCEIIPTCCPYQIDHALPDYDVDTFISSDSCNGPGCRGITCEECWDTELPERPIRTDWRNATDQEVSAMSFEEATLIIQKQIDLGHSKGDLRPRAHITRAMEIVLVQAKKNTNW